MTILEYNKFCQSLGLTKYYENTKYTDEEYMSDYVVKSSISPSMHHTGFNSGAYRTCILGYQSITGKLLLYDEYENTVCSDIKQAEEFAKRKMKEVYEGVARIRKDLRKKMIEEL